MSKRIYIHNKRDNVAVALENLEPGDIIRIGKDSSTLEIKVKEKIPFGHKVALERIKKGQEVIKYGEVIGVATEDIEPGAHVHVHNLRSLKFT